MQRNDTVRICRVVQIPCRAYTASPYCFIVMDHIQALFSQDNFKPNAISSRRRIATIFNLSLL
jgi:hypothetical protein